MPTADPPRPPPAAAGEPRGTGGGARPAPPCPGLRSLRAFAGLGGLAGAALLAVIGIGTLEQDRAASAASVRLAGTAVQARLDGLGREARERAGWPEAPSRPHPAVDVRRADGADRLGRGLQGSGGWEYGFVLDAAGRTARAVDRGEVANVDASARVAHGLDRLVATARGAAGGGTPPGPATGLVEVAGGVALAAAAAMPSAAGPAPDGPAAPGAAPPVLVLLDALDREALGAVAASYLLRDLRLEAAPPAGRRTAGLPLVAADGATLGWLAWRPARPGTALLRAALPWLLAVCGAGALLALLAGRSVRRAAAATAAGAAAVAASEERFRDVATTASDWIFETDGELRLTYLSGRFAELAGLPVAAALGRPLLEVVEPDGPEGAAAGAWAALADGSLRGPARGLRASLRDAAGGRRALRLACRPVMAADGTVARVRGAAADVTDEVEARARADFLALHDPLTGLANRLLFADRLAEAVAAARRDGRPSAVLFLDLDRFKEVNDTLGHPAGDRLLREVAARLRALARETDLVARLGGDEFAILLAGVGDAAAAEAFCRRALAAAAGPFELEGETVHAGTSLGAAFLPGDADGAEDAMRCADLALYRAKAEGRGTFRFYAPEMNAELARRRAVERDLRRALAAGGFELLFQPKYRTDTGELAGVEALLRWRHPERGLLGPDGFIEVAERTGLIVPIGEWVVAAACAHAAGWPGLRVAVNLSPAQLRSSRLVAAVRGALERSGLAPDRLELEVTEAPLARDLDDARAVLLELKGLGVRLALDDFGAGDGSLAYPHGLPFDRIKIDRGFVARLGVAAEAEAVVRAIVTLGRGLGMATTAEGVESPAQLEFLRDVGCGEVQGFLLGPPMLPAAVARLARGADAARLAA